MQVRRTAALGVVASLVSGASLFLVFRFGIAIAGASQVGVWVLIQSAFILARLPETGVGVNLTRIVLIDSKDNNRLDLRNYFLSGMILTVIPTLVLGLILIEPTTWFISTQFHGNLSLSVIRSLVWLSFLTAGLNSFASVVLAIIEGKSRLQDRQLLTIFSNGLLAITTYWLIHKFDILGVAIAYVLAAGALSSAALVLLITVLNTGQADTVPTLLKRLWLQNATVSAMALMRMSFEPWTKFLVASSGGLIAAAYLDLAIRVTSQIRVAVQSSTQPLLTLGARSRGGDVGDAAKQFQFAHHLIITVNIILISSQLLLSPFISFIGLGAIRAQFIGFMVMLSIGSSVNSFGVVGYYYDASGGEMGRILRIHAQMMAINFILGGLSYYFNSPEGVVGAFALSFAFGGIELSRSWMAAGNLSWRATLYSERCQIVFALGSFVTLLSVIRASQYINNSLSFALASLALGLAFSGLALLNIWRKHLQEVEP